MTKCGNLVEWLDGIILLCEKGDGFYVPNLSDMKKYCKSREHYKCPFYSKFSDFSSEINMSCFDGKVINNEIYSK